MSEDKPDPFRKLYLSDFENRVGAEFSVSLETSEEPITQIRLSNVANIGAEAFGRVPFSIIFEGTPDIPLQQQLYWLRGEDMERFAIFLVPISGNSEIRRYQAVFN